MIEAGGGHAWPSPADVREPDQVQRVVDAGIERFGYIDVLVNNAGGQFTAPAEDISDNGWRAVHRLAVDAAWTVTRTVATRSMIPRRGGLIVFIGFSPLARQPRLRPRLRGPRRGRQPRLRPGPRVERARDPQRLPGPGHDRAPRAGASTARPRSSAGARAVPLGRLGEPAEEVAALIAFLASPAAAYITGTTIAVDGGADAWGLAEPPPR